MGNLILNEHIKALAKISTVIMLAFIVIVAIGFNGIMRIAANQMSNYMGSNSTQQSIDEYNERIRYAEEQKYPGWEDEVEVYTALRDNPTHITWKNDIISMIYNNLKPLLREAEESVQIALMEAQIEQLQGFYDKNDWKGYIQFQYIDPIEQSSTLTDEEKELQAWMWQYCLDHDIEPTTKDEEGNTLWKYSYVQTVHYTKASYQQEMDKPEGERNQQTLETARQTILIGEYRLENEIETCTLANEDITNTDNMGYWTVFGMSAMMLSIISVLIIIVAGGIIASEFSGGTIKFLLINPVRRWKILVAKYITVLSIAFVMMLLFYIVNALLAMAFFGASEIGAPHLRVVGDSVVSSSSYLYVARNYLLASVGTFVMATFAFALSSLFRNSALSIGLGVFLMLSGSGAVSILAQFNFDWARYILFANTDLLTISQGNSPFMEHSLTFAVINLSIYMVVFMLTAWDGFLRRDIR